MTRIPADPDTLARAHTELAAFDPIPGVDRADVVKVVAFLADLDATDRRALLRAAENVAIARYAA
jgi:hypothetical protein